MNHYKFISDIVCGMCRDKEWLKIDEHGFCSELEFDTFSIKGCSSYSSVDFEVSLKNKSDDTILNEILKFSKSQKVVEDKNTFFINKINSLWNFHHSLFFYVTRDRVRKIKDKGLKLVFSDIDNHKTFYPFTIENKTTEQVYKEVESVLSVIKRNFELDYKISELIHRMNYEKWDKFIKLQPKLFKLLKEKFNQ